MAKHLFSIGDQVTIKGMDLEVVKITKARLHLRLRKGEGLESLDGLQSSEQRAYLRGFLDHEKQLKTAPTGAALNITIAREKLGLEKEECLSGGALGRLTAIAALTDGVLRTVAANRDEEIRLTLILRSVRDGGRLLERFQEYLDAPKKEIEEVVDEHWDELMEVLKDRPDDVVDALGLNLAAD